MASRILMVVLVLVTLAAVGVAVYLAMRPASSPAPKLALVTDPANPSAPATLALVTQPTSAVSSAGLTMTPAGATQRAFDEGVRRQLASIADGLGDFAR